MTLRRDPPSAAPDTARPTAAKDRLALALRENLRRRKAQISGRRAQAAREARANEDNDSN